MQDREALGPVAAVRALPRAAWVIAALVLFAAAALFGSMQALDVKSDFAAHGAFVRELIASGLVSGEFLLYVVTAAVAGLQTDDTAIAVALTIVLAVAATAKYVVSAALATSEARTRRTALLVAVALLGIAFSFPVTNVYLGQLPPNVFHNSTTIFLLPLALLLFWCAALYLRTAERRWLVWLCVLAALNVAAKPSFVVIMIAVFPFFAAVRLVDARAQYAAFGATVLMTLFVLAQYLYVFETDAHPRLREAVGLDIEVAGAPRIAPFDVWSHYSGSIPLSLAASIAFPAVAAAVYRGRLLRYDLVQLAGWLFVVGVLVFALVAESGDMRYHGNFAWQAIVASYVLFLVVLTRVAMLWDFAANRAGSLLVVAAFGAHVVAGVAFVTRLLWTKTYF